MPQRKKKQAVLEQAYLGKVTGPTDQRSQRIHLLEHWGAHPWNWLTARDTDGSPVILTRDEADHKQPLKPYPSHVYLKHMVGRLYTAPMIFLNKPRQIMASWTVLLTVDWFCRFRQAQLWLLSKSTEDEAKQMMRDKIAHVHKHLPPWVQAALPMKDKPANRYTYTNTQSQLLAVAENAADKEFRGNTASGIVVDEAAFQENFREMVAAAIPMDGRIIALSTANIGNPGAVYCREILGI